MGNSNGKVCVVTGALGSLGMEMSKQLARQGATVVMVSRDPERAKAARDEVAEAGGTVETLNCDLGSLASIRTAAKELTARHPKIHVLINNAAVYTGARQTTVDGFERMFGLNHLSPFLFTQLLGDALEAGKGRVVNLTMPVKSPIAFDDLQSEKGFSAFPVFGMTKAAGHYFTRELAARWEARGITVNAFNPGMTRTTLVREAPLPLRIVFALFAAQPEKSVDGAVWLALAPEAAGVTGRLFEKRKQVAFPKPSDAADLRRRLWDESARLTGLTVALKRAA